MPKKCIDPGCTRDQWGGGYCLYHQWKRKDKVRKPQKRFSKKREKLNRKYEKKSLAFRQANPFCRIASPVCVFHTHGVHHVKGRIGELLMDENEWIPACNPCNRWVEEHPEEAEKLGFKKSKFN